MTCPDANQKAYLSTNIAHLENNLCLKMILPLVVSAMLEVLFTDHYIPLDLTTDLMDLKTATPIKHKKCFPSLETITHSVDPDLHTQKLSK